MSKRGASEQITRENHLDHESDDEPKSVKLASASVLAKRKILKPRGRTPGSSVGSSASPAPSFGASTVGSSGLFGSVKAQDRSKSTEPSVKPFTFASSNGSEKSEDKNEKIKALNAQFIETLNRSHKEGHVANFTEAAKKYIEYYSKIERGEIKIRESESGKAVFESKTSLSLSGSITKPGDQATSVEKPKVVETKAESDSSSDSEEEIKVEGPKFTLNAKPTVKNSPFSFGPKPAKKADSGSDSESEIEIKGPTFNFNKPIKDNVFKLGDAKSSSINASNKNASTQKNDSKPAFSFGSSTAGKNDEPKPAFSFGSSTEKKDESKPTFSFGASTEKKDESKPAFSFGSASTENKDESKPAFSFGASTSNSDNKGIFSGSSTSDSTPKPFSFGSENKETKDEKPKSSLQFSFNPPSQSSEKPAFSFGSSNPGTPLFGNNNSTPSFTFNSTSNKIETELNSATPDTQQEAEPSEEDTGGNFKAVAQLSSEKVDSQTGEEDEEALYTKRSKLMLFDPSNTENPYASKGLGDLKILRNKVTGKSRILVRAEGGLRVLLNTLVNKDMAYTTIGNGSMVRVPTVNPTDKSIETYILKVKTADDGKKLLDILNDVKK
mmetsp:Transcript_6619/g.8347  ORF Transcript_6619/g.8347 Transcript_6619/m.8347 type:complete len:610 (-) Transcript_6619:5035-6864(-)